MDALIASLTAAMALEHAWIGSSALLKSKTVGRGVGVPLSLFEITYYLALSFSTFGSPVLFSLVVFFLLVHLLGGAWYIRGKLGSYAERKFYVGYSVFEFVELAFLLFVFALFA